MVIQILIPHNKNKEFMVSTTVPAILSVGLNLLFLPQFGYVGAAIVSVLTEALVWAIQLFFTRKYLKEVPIIGSMTKIVLGSAIMYVILLASKTFIHFSSVINVLVFVVLGGIIYLFLILSLKVVDVTELKQMIRKN